MNFRDGLKNEMKEVKEEVEVTYLGGHPGRRNVEWGREGYQIISYARDAETPSYASDRWTTNHRNSGIQMKKFQKE